MRCGAYMCEQPAEMAFIAEATSTWHLRCEDCAYEAYVHADRHLMGLKRLSMTEFLVWLTHHE